MVAEIERLYSSNMYHNMQCVRLPFCSSTSIKRSYSCVIAIRCLLMYKTFKIRMLKILVIAPATSRGSHISFLITPPFTVLWTMP